MACFQKSSYTNLKSEFKLSHLWRREVKPLSFRILTVTFPIFPFTDLSFLRFASLSFLQK